MILGSRIFFYFCVIHRQERRSLRLTFRFPDLDCDLPLEQTFWKPRILNSVFMPGHAVMFRSLDFTVL